jgi:hypothetical protein
MRKKEQMAKMEKEIGLHIIQIPQEAGIKVECQIFLHFFLNVLKVSFLMTTFHMAVLVEHL